MKELEYELSYSIFNNIDLIQKIGLIRNNLYLFMSKVQETVSYGEQTKASSLGNMISDNIFKKERGMLETYLNIGIRHPLMDKFESDCRLFRKIDQLKPIELERY